MMAVAALLSTAGCTNATLYASDALTRPLTELRLFPPTFGPKGPFGKHSGLIVTTALVLVIANAFDLGAIASVGSAVSLTAFLLVGLAGWRRRRDTGSNPVLIIASLTS